MDVGRAAAPPALSQLAGSIAAPIDYRGLRSAGGLLPTGGAGVRRGGRCKNCYHHKGNAAVDGHHTSLRRGDLRTIHVSPACLRTADFVNLRIESEIALKLGASLPASGAPWTREAVASAVVGAMPAFELIEDRNADYTAADAASLIVENCWNGGVVIGTPKVVSVEDLVGIAGRLMVGGTTIGEGMAEDPCATLAWLANHLAERGRDMKAGMVVITGSVIPTVSIAVGDRAVFSVDGLGEAVMDVL